MTIVASSLRSRRLRSALALLGLGLTPFACVLNTEGTGPATTGTGGGEAGCKAGETRACYTGPEGTQDQGVCKAGTQTCGAEGTFGECTGEVLPAPVDDCGTPVDDDCNGQVDDGCDCETPGEERDCYSGAPATKGVGPCHGGTQVCGADGKFGACTGEVVPASEDCTTAEDEDCDGKAFDDADSGCVCEPATEMSCYTGPDGTLDVGACKGGVKTCDADGKAYSDCVGQVLPGAEDCATPKDEDCDGKVFDDADSGCVCEPGLGMMSCSTGQPGVCGPGLQTCDATGKGYGACVQAVQPSYDDCANALDEDCDGTALACVGNTLVSKGGGGTALDDVAFAVATDASENVFVAGVTNGATNNFLVTAGATWIHKYSPTGQALWAGPKSFAATGGGNYAVVRGAAATSDGGVVVVGEYKGSNLNFGGSNLSTGGVDVFLAKLDKDGNHVWSKDFGDGSDQSGYAIAVDASDNIYITGEADGNIDFGGGNAAGGGAGTDAFVAKFDKTGKHLWSKLLGGDDVQIGWGIAATPDGVVIVGGLAGSTNFGGGLLSSLGGVDVFAVKLSAMKGDHLWSARYGGADDQVAYAVASDAKGNVVLTGYYITGIDWGNGSVLGSSGNADVFVTRLDGSTGNVLWAKGFGDVNTQEGYAIATDPAGNAIVAGRFRGTFNFGGADLVDPDLNTSDGFVAKLASSNGGHLWSRRLGDKGPSTDAQFAWGVASDKTGNALVVGGFKGTVDFGAGTSTSAGGHDVFAVKLSP